MGKPLGFLKWGRSAEIEGALHGELSNFMRKAMLESETKKMSNCWEWSDTKVRSTTWKGR